MGSPTSSRRRWRTPSPFFPGGRNRPGLPQIQQNARMISIRVFELNALIQWLLLQGSLWDIAKRIKSLQTNQVKWREESDKRLIVELFGGLCPG
ncbi:hypothetical protein OPV22_020618 [Ensete ventricosum]|uniref:Uncharacterized protein n=1 Tax=Ensete ventricosum TaxID=4639 RepID=A0AAV8QEW1_ENSVE|nr:hypothetical protein OPV22_020618 [Ensete ventricosum]